MMRYDDMMTFPPQDSDLSAGSKTFDEEMSLTDAQLETTPFESAHEALRLYRELFIALCMFNIAKNPDKMIDDIGAYAPRRVAFREILSQLTGDPSSKAVEWLRSNKIPNCASCSEIASALWHNIEIRIKATQQASDAQSAADGILPLQYLEKRFGLHSFETMLIGFLALIQSDETSARAYAYATGDSAEAIANAGFLGQCLAFFDVSPQRFRSMFAPASPLIRYGLIRRVHQAAWGEETPLHQMRLLLPNKILGIILCDGENAIPPRLSCANSAKLSAGDPLFHCRKRIEAAMAADTARIAAVDAPDCGEWLQEVIAACGYRSTVIDSQSLQSDYPDGDIGELARDLILCDSVLVVRWHEPTPGPETSRDIAWFKTIGPRICQRLKSEPRLRLCVIADRQSSLTRAVFGDLAEIELPKPSQADQMKLWNQALALEVSKERARQIADRLSGGYCLSLREIQSAIEQTRAHYPDAELSADLITQTLNKTRGRSLEGLASLRSTTLTLDDIVLSDGMRATFDEVLAYARHRDTVMHQWGFDKYNASGAGLCVLLSGVPGTGKTLSALVLAHELRRALYVIDLSRIVDKYIGETEKKLATIFDEAERSQAVLLFDEADSLFSKRTNVKSSNDRYANLEVNYLLQRLEAYRGVSIMTTNFADGLDEALARRIPFKVHFPMPDEAMRAILWQRLIPPRAPIGDDVDYEALGHAFEMSGGHIKNAVFRAAIRAAQENNPIDHAMLWDAALQEFREMGHVIRDTATEQYY